MIQIINGFKINSINPIDSRIIVADDATRLAIQYKYHGLRVWQTNTNTPYFWDGTAWKSELDLVVTGVDGDVSVGTVPVFTSSNPVKIGDSIISATPDLVTINGDLSFDSIISGSINADFIDTGTMSVSRLQKGNPGQVLQTVGTVVQWKNLSDLTIGTSTNSVNSNNLKIKTINVSGTYQLILRNTDSTISDGGDYIELYGNTNGLKFKNDGNNGLRILAHNGSSTNPPYSFDSSPTTGMYSPTTNQIGFSANGSTNLVIGNGFVTFGNNITTGEPRIRTGNNTSPTTPSYTWYGNDQTGIYRPVQDVIGFSIAGQQAVRITSSYINFGLSSTGTPIIKNNSGNNSTPSYTWYGDSDTGMYRIDPNIIGFSTNGVLRLKIENDGTTVNNNFYLPSPNGSTPAAGKILTAVDGTGNSEWLNLYDGNLVKTGFHGFYKISNDIEGSDDIKSQNETYLLTNTQPFTAPFTGYYQITMSISTRIDFDEGGDSDRHMRFETYIVKTSDSPDPNTRTELVGVQAGIMGSGLESSSSGGGQVLDRFYDTQTLTWSGYLYVGERINPKIKRGETSFVTQFDFYYRPVNSKLGSHLSWIGIKA